MVLLVHYLNATRPLPRQESKKHPRRAQSPTRLSPLLSLTNGHEPGRKWLWEGTIHGLRAFSARRGEPQVRAEEFSAREWSWKCLYWKFQIKRMDKGITSQHTLPPSQNIWFHWIAHVSKEVKKKVPLNLSKLKEKPISQFIVVQGYCNNALK